MAAEKTVNYTPEMTAKVVAEYAAGATVEDLAESMGKSVRSIVAKLSREGVYKAKAYVSNTGTAPVRKDAHADAIGALCNMTESEIESMAKANKTALVKVLGMLERVIPEMLPEPPAEVVFPQGWDKV